MVINNNQDPERASVTDAAQSTLGYPTEAVEKNLSVRDAVPLRSSDEAFVTEPNSLCPCIWSYLQHGAGQAQGHIPNANAAFAYHRPCY